MNWISDCFRQAIDQTAETGVEWCVTLESKHNPKFYVQFTSEHINLAYPHNQHPAEILDGLPEFLGCRISDWESNSYLTLEHGIGQAIEQVGEFVENYILDILDVSAEKSSWSVSGQHL